MFLWRSQWSSIDELHTNRNQNIWNYKMLKLTSAFRKVPIPHSFCLKGFKERRPLSVSHVARPGSSTLYRFSLFSAAKSFRFLLASWSRVSCCRQGPQLTSSLSPAPVPIWQGRPGSWKLGNEPSAAQLCTILPPIPRVSACIRIFFPALKHTVLLKGGGKAEMDWVGSLAGEKSCAG